VIISHPSRIALRGVVVAMLAGCGAVQPPITVPGVIPQTSEIATRADHRGSWMLSEAKRSDLLYVSDEFTRNVNVFTFPKGKQTGSLTGFTSPEGECVDASGDVFVTDDRDSQASRVVEYPHGGKRPTLTLNTPGTPRGCSVDAATGNLAVVEQGDIAIYEGARGTPVILRDPDMVATFYCSYDSAGNLYVSGAASSGDQPVFGKVLRGHRSFTNFTVVASFLSAWVPIMWDGRYLAIGDYESRDGSYPVYRVKVARAKGQVVSTTVLDTTGIQTLPAGPMWIQGGKVILTGEHGPYCCPIGAVGLWNFPAGGHRTRRIVMPGYAVRPYGATVSLARP
jgi:hypothetical protein